MATTVRLDGAADTARRAPDTPVLVIAADQHAGTFADAVARALQSARFSVGRVTATHARGRPSWWPTGMLRVLCAVAPAPALEDVLDHGAASGLGPGLPVILEHPLLRVGPLLVPGSPCSGCLRLRRRQFDPHAGYQDAYEAALAAGAPGPLGVLPHEAALAGALAAEEASQFQRTGQPSVPGRVRWADLVELRVASDHVVGLHGCVRCGGAAGTPGCRSWQRLQADLRPLTGSRPTKTEGDR